MHDMILHFSSNQAHTRYVQRIILSYSLHYTYRDCTPPSGPGAYVEAAHAAPPRTRGDSRDGGENTDDISADSVNPSRILRVKVVLTRHLEISGYASEDGRMEESHYIHYDCEPRPNR